MADEAVVLQNGGVRVQIDPARGTFQVVERGTETLWGADPYTGSPGELTLRDRAAGRQVTLDLAQAGSVRVDQLGAQRASLSFEALRAQDGTSLDAAVHVTLEVPEDAPELRITVERVAYDAARFDFVSLLYPLRQFALRTHEGDGYLAIPYNQGCLVPSGRFRLPLRDDHYIWDDLSWQARGLAWGTEGALAEIPIYGWSALTMPWYGAVVGNNGDGTSGISDTSAGGTSAFMALVETENDAAFQFLLNFDQQDEFNARAVASPYPRIAAGSPRWLAEKGSFSYARRLTYRFFPGGTHVDMAKHYREVARRQGLLVTLAEKMARNPEVGKLFGAPVINIDGGYPWYTDYTSFMYTWRDLKKIVQDVHDTLGVKRAVVCTWGGYSKLPPESYPFHPEWGTEAELRDAVQTAQRYGYLYTSYHGYPALLTHSTSFDPEEGARNAAGAIGGRWGGRCSVPQLAYAQRDLPRIVETTGQTSDYSDIITAGGLRECYHPAHPVTRTEDRAAKLRVLDYIRSLGLVNGSEVAQGYMVPHADYAKGAMYVGLRYWLLQHIHAPLFSLVFHDCMVTYDGGVGTSRRKEYTNELLECLAYGVQPMVSFNLPHYAGARRVLQETAALTSDFQHATGADELVSHTYLGGFDVQQTVFSSGARVTINTDTAPFTAGNGLEVPARGVVIERRDAPPQTGAIETRAGWRTAQ